MKNPSYKIVALTLLAGALSFTACGEKTDSAAESTAAAEEVKIPESPDGAVQFIAHELAKGNGAVLWQAMPASYQNDVNSIAQLAGAKIDAEIYDKVFATVNRAVAVLDKQKAFVFGSSLAGGQSDEAGAEQMRAAWPSIKKIVETLTASPLASAAGLQSFEGAAFFKDTVSNLLGDIDALVKLDPEREQSLLSSLSNVAVRYVEGTENEAILEMSIPGEEVEAETFVKVEGRWVPQDMADEWTTQMAEARTQLEAIDPAQMEQQKPQILNVFAMIDGVITQIEGAETQAQFDQALQGAMMPLMGLMMMGQGMGGGGAPAMPSGNNAEPVMLPPPGMPNMPTAPTRPTAP
jgi:hypothetical protein